ncbi:hypothetical protein KI387_000940, partial [Taxus chinensis]
MVLKDLITSEDKKSFPKAKVLQALETVSGEHMELKYMLRNTREGFQMMQMEWNDEMYNIEKYTRGLPKAASGYDKVLEENRQLYNQVQDLKEQVFLDTQPLIRSVLDGYNVCIFAYGQMGSGKTYTMAGPKVITEENWGVNYRALNDLFQISEQRKDVFTYDVVVQMIEIYNEQVRDLLVSDGKDLTSGMILRGCLHLVDLAGSERVDKSEATGDKLKKHINKSLSALGYVIAALAQKNSHVPCRNSKLTQLLQDSLGGQAKTLMFVHISPEVDAYGETMSTLKFAERVATVELGAAKSNKESGEIRELKEQIANLKNALAKKEAEADQVQITTDSRISPEMQRMRSCVSPLPLRRQSLGDVQTQVRSDCTGRQKRPIYSRDTQPVEIIDDSPLCREDLCDARKLVRLPSPGLPSPGLLSPSLSSPDIQLAMFDRNSHTKNKIKHDMFEEQDVRNWQEKVMVNKHIPMRGLPSQDDVYGSWEALRQEKQDILPEFYYQRCPSNLRKVYPNCEEEKFSPQQIYEMHGGIRSGRPDAKGKCEYEGQKTPLETDESEVELETRSKDDYQTTDSSEADLLWQFNVPNVPAVTPVEHVSRLKKPQHSITKTPEGRSPSQAQNLPPAVKNYRKMLNGNGQSQGRTGRQLPSTGGKSKLEPIN